MTFHCNPEEALDMTMQNLQMYNLCIPSYKTEDDKKNELVTADKGSDDKVRALLGFKKTKKRKK